LEDFLPLGEIAAVTFDVDAVDEEEDEGGMTEPTLERFSFLSDARLSSF